MAERHDQHGTGRHHTKDEGKQHGRSHDQGRGREDEPAHAGASHSSRQHESDSADLKRREYRGEDGQIHHHTHPYMEEHRGKDDNRGGEHRGGDRDGHKGGSDRHR